jgi:hypothetical protein
VMAQLHHATQTVTAPPAAHNGAGTAKTQEKEPEHAGVSS